MTNNAQCFDGVRQFSFNFTLNVSDSLMFWTDWGDRAAGIYRSYMDGTNVSCIVSEGVRWPNGITADDHWLYWTEAYSDRIERADFTGGQRSVLIEGLPHPYAIAVFKVRLNTE